MERATETILGAWVEMARANKIIHKISNLCSKFSSLSSVVFINLFSFAWLSNLQGILAEAILSDWI